MTKIFSEFACFPQKCCKEVLQKKLMAFQMNGWTDEWIYQWMAEWMGGQMVELMAMTMAFAMAMCHHCR